jgi:hypothetical protein
LAGDGIYWAGDALARSHRRGLVAASSRDGVAVARTQPGLRNARLEPARWALANRTWAAACGRRRLSQSIIEPTQRVLPLAGPMADDRTG